MADTYIIGSSQKVETFKFLEVTTAHADQVMDFVHAHDPVGIFGIPIPVRETSQGVVILLTLCAPSCISIVGASVTRFAKFLEVFQDVFNSHFFQTFVVI
jgi:hypothetical protein